jgi:hypothetical protein
MAGTILSQASFGTMTECVSARDATVQHNKEVVAICSYQANKPEKDNAAVFEKFFENFKVIIKELHQMEQENLETFKPFNEGSPRCGGLAVEPNEWIRKDMSNPSSLYEPLC